MAFLIASWVRIDASWGPWSDHLLSCVSGIAITHDYHFARKNTVAGWEILRVLPQMLFALKAAVFKVQGTAVFGYRANYVVGHISGNFGLDFQGYFYVGPD